jgi:hypothetical protein
MPIGISMKKVAFLLVIALFSACLFINESSIISSSEHQPNNNTVGYELLDSNQVLHIWNTEDDYYFNATSGMQFTNHYEDYWSKNVFCGGYYNGDEWIKLACVDELPFTWSISTDNDTYINVTGYKDVTYSGYKVRFALRYHLKDEDDRMTVIPYMKNIGTKNIPVDLGFAWHIRNIQIDMQEENNSITVYDNKDGFYNLDLHGLNAQNKSNVRDFILNNDDNGEHIHLSWNESIPYVLNVTSSPGQYNSPVTLGLKAGTLNVGQEKKTELKWIDAKVYCDAVGDDDWDKICFVVGAYQSPSYSNFSDGENPIFKITMGNAQPFVCSLVCKIDRKYGYGGSWITVFTGMGTFGCYNANIGQKAIQHTSTHENLTRWRLRSLYSGQPYCSGQSNLFADQRYNMSSNEHTPTSENVTLKETILLDYQEDANSTEGVGDWFDAFGLGFDKVVDGDWSTSGFAQSNGVGYFNYSKPCNALSAMWEIKDVGATTNLTIPDECFNQEILELKLEDSASFPFYVNWSCWNGSEWHYLRDYSVSPVVYEEAINWNLSYYEADFAFYDLDTDDQGDLEWLNLTRWYINGTYDSSYDNITLFPNCSTLGCGVNLTYDVQVWDDSYFSPTGNEVYNDSNVSMASGGICPLRLYNYKLAIIFTFLGTAGFLIFSATKLDESHKAIKLLLVGFALFLFVALFQMASLFSVEAVPLGGFYSVFLFFVIFVMALIIVIYIKNLFFGMKIKAK